MPKFSIIIPTFNAAKTIVGCVESLACQTWRDFEVLVQDGVSNDETLTVIERLGHEFPRLQIRTESKRDAGVYDAMNRAIDRARGEWILILGSDDRLFAPDTLERIAGHLASEFDVVYGDVIAPHISPRTDGRYIGRMSVERILESNICHQAIFFQRSLFDRIGKFDLRYRILADWEHNFRWFLCHRVRVKYVDEIVARFAQGGLSSVVPDPRFGRERVSLYIRHGQRVVPLRRKFELARCDAVSAIQSRDWRRLLWVMASIPAILARTVRSPFLRLR